MHADQSELSPEPAPRGPLLGLMFCFGCRLVGGRESRGGPWAVAVYSQAEKFPHEHMVWL